MPDFELNCTWPQIEHAALNPNVFVTMSGSTASMTSAEIYAALLSNRNQNVMMIGPSGNLAVMYDPPESSSDTAKFVSVTDSGYTVYVINSSGTVTTSSGSYGNNIVFATFFMDGSTLVCDKTLSDIAAGATANGFVGCVTPEGYGVLSSSDTDYATFTVIDASAATPVLFVYSVNRYGVASVTEISLGVSGSATKTFGFVSINAYRTFRTTYPDAISVGDYVWIRGGDAVIQSHTLYQFIAAAVTDNLQKVYAINDDVLVVVSYNSGYTADKTFAQIMTAYNDGKRPVLQTEFGQIIPATRVDSTSIRFSGAIDAGSDGFWVVTYTITASGVSARGVMTEFIPVFLSVSNGVYDVVSWPSFISGNAVLFAIQALQNGAKVAAVVPGATDAYIHPMNYYVGTNEIHFAGIERETISGVDYLRAVTYVIGVSLQHVQRIVGQTVLAPTNNDIGKVWTATAAGKGEWVTPSGGADPEDIVAAVETWLEENIDNPSNPPLDKSLLVEGAAADAAAAGAAIDRVFYQSAKMKLLEILRGIRSWRIDNAAELIAELEGELFPEGDVESIDAVYTQDGAVIYPDTPLDALRADLVVTATLSDSSTRIISDYTLTGTLTAGTSTVTVHYRDLTDTFSVTVTAAPTEVSITALYTQGSTVVTPYTPINSLKSDLVVMVNYSNTTSRQLDPTEYTLSGTLTEGTSTVDVAYHGFTDEFTVTVGPAPTVPASFDTDGLICCIDGKQINENLWYNLVTGVPFVLHNVTVETDGVTFSGSSDSYGESTETFGSALTIEVVYKAAADSGNYAFFGTHQVSGGALCLMHSKSSGKIFSAYNSSSKTVHVTPVVQIGMLSATRGDSNSPAQIAVLNGTTVSNTTTDYTTYPSSGIEGSKIGTHGFSSMMFKGEILMVCIYNKRKTADEMQANQAVYDAYYSMGILNQS